MHKVYTNIKSYVLLRISTERRKRKTPVHIKTRDLRILYELRKKHALPNL